MLESWKETEANNEEDEAESEGDEAYVPDAVADVVQEEEKLKAAAEELAKAQQVEPALNRTLDHDLSVQASLGPKITPWIKFNFFEVASPNWLEDVCLPGEAPLKESVVEPVNTLNLTSTISSSNLSSPSSITASETTISSVATSTSTFSPKAEPVVSSSSAVKESSAPISVPSNSTSSPETPVSSTSSPPASKSQNVTTTPKNKTTSTSSASSSLPTIQESFFKAVSRRLNFLETNSTLSLKYIEEQSRILREAFTKVEKKQLQKTNTFLDTLNSTVLDELRQFRQQYDEIWQSTIISLESQREESRREILAVTSRLNILADEVVFQKRMSIVQSVLVLLCLGLVIFTHVSGGGPLDYASMNSRMRMLSGYGMESPIESPPQSPEYSRRSESMRGGSPWLEVNDRRQRGDDMRSSRSRSRGDESPQTPMSAYSETEEMEMTPPSGADDVFIRTEAELPALPTEDIESPEPSKPLYHRAGTFGDSIPLIPNEIVITAPEIPSQSPKRTPRKRNSIWQQASPPASEAGDNETNVPDLLSSPASEPQPIPQLEFLDESTPASSLPNHSRSTSNPDLSLAPPPRLPSPPPEPFESSTNGHGNMNGNDVGVAVPMRNGSGSAHSTPSQIQHPQTNTSSSPAVQPHSSPPGEAQPQSESSPTSNRHKRQSFSIARKPLPALPPNP